jgi:hypothetical protein
MTTLNIKNKKGVKSPIILNKEQIAKVETLAAFMSIVDIANYFNFSEKTFHNIKLRQPEVNTAYRVGREKAYELVASKLMKQIKDDNLTAIMFYLKTKRGWSEKQELDVTSNVSDTLQPIILNINKTNNADRN